jgi:hypothetical protein
MIYFNVLLRMILEGSLSLSLFAIINIVDVIIKIIISFIYFDLVIMGNFLSEFLNYFCNYYDDFIAIIASLHSIDSFKKIEFTRLSLLCKDYWIIVC